MLYKLMYVMIYSICLSAALPRTYREAIAKHYSSTCISLKDEALQLMPYSI